eukprot:3152764-Rhodomonas_salina.1
MAAATLGGLMWAGSTAKKIHKNATSVPFVPQLPDIVVDFGVSSTVVAVRARKPVVQDAHGPMRILVAIHKW